MQANIKKTLASLIVAILIAAALPMSAFAEIGVGDKNNSGSGSGGGSVNSAYTWTTSQSGYRFQIIDENFKPVSNTVDLMFSPASQITNQNDRYTNSRATALSSDNSKWTFITIDDLYSSKDFKGAKYPPVPIKFVDVNGMSVAQAQGEAFKKWFLSGAGSITRPTISVTTGSSPSTSNNSYSPSSTTKPNLKDEIKNVSDMAYVSEFSLINSAAYRTDNHWKAFTIVMEQGYYSDAQKIIESQVSAIKKIISLRRMKEDKSANLIQYEEISAAINFHKSISKSYAEFVYIATSVISHGLGVNWEPEGNLILAQQTDKFNLNYTNEVKNTVQILEPIPLASGSNDEGYAMKFLNFDTGGKFLFDLPGTNINDRNKFVTSVMIEKGYSVIVEPIFWMVPAAGNSSGLPTSPIHSNYVYGTVGNHIEFAKNHGFKYGSSGGAYGVILGNLGWRSMFLGEDWVGNGITLKGFAELTGKKSLSDLNSMLTSKQGVAMHIYITSGSSSQTTRDYSKGSTAHPAPDPSLLAGDDKKYKIVKYYEQELSDGSIDRNKFVTVTNPPKITINDEIKYRLKDWFISTSDSDGNADYASSKTSLSNTRTGTKSEAVELKDGELTLHLLLTKGSEAQAEAGPLTLGESEISKAITTMNDTIPNWGKRLFTFSYASMAGSDTHYCSDDDCSGHSCTARFGDASYNYIISNSAAINDKLEANSAGGVFKARMINNTKSGNASLTGGTNQLDSAEYQSVLWRGLDVPTIASYKENANIPIKSLLNRYGIKPAGDRGVNGSYNLDLLAQLSVSESSDLKTNSVHSYDGALWKTATRNSDTVASHTGEVTVQTYRGLNAKDVGSETKTNEIQTVTPFGNATSIHSAGYMVLNSTSIQFYPYIRMTYQTVGSNVKNEVNIVSQFVSSILPNDFAEASWHNVNEAESLALSSTQWSMHARATNAGKSWNGPNRVLPGGAIFQLGTGTSPTRVSLVTWQTLITGNERNALAVQLPANEYTLNKANSEHNAYVQEAKTVLENLRIVQWVNTDPEASNAWMNNGKSVKITGGNESLAALGLNTKTSTEDKYLLKPDSGQDSANESDLDIINTTNSLDVFFKIIASPDGTIHLAKSIGSLDALQNINGTNLSGGSGVTVTKILNKSVTWEKVQDSLTDEDARALNQRTMAITNIVKSLERNRGNDPSASWSSDGRWYNESFEITVVRKCTTLNVGFLKTPTRTSVSDPKLCPPSSGQSNMFEKAFLSQFRVNNKSDVALDKPDGFIGSFQSKDIKLPNMENLYVSKKWFIPNVNVQDLH
ncbi:hypothetical protein JCM17380_13030 [Desulfosporosinus burensis]